MTVIQLALLWTPPRSTYETLMDGFAQAIFRVDRYDALDPVQQAQVRAASFGHRFGLGFEAR